MGALAGAAAGSAFGRATRALSRRTLTGLTLLPAAAAALVPIVATSALAASSTACGCGERGSPIVLEPDALTVAHTIRAEGIACETIDLQCVQRNKGSDRCEIYWLVPRQAGACTVTVTFEDGGSVARTIDYLLDEKYPCRGQVKPDEDRNMTRISRVANPEP